MPFSASDSAAWFAVTSAAAIASRAAAVASR